MKLFHAETGKRLVVRNSIDGEPIPVDKSSNKKVKKAGKKKDKDSSMLKKKLIKELESPSSSSSTISQTKTITNSGNFTDLYNAITKAEERTDITNQEVIRCIFCIWKRT
ncbi:7930_t:CDS:2 [Ambispora gerdemannii]|uniref:7930_t:CDS:1 n=1 Tax=Ambispora gerdemannii TaxID=144530 RepID=A0A9N9AZ79_9GLOM|nr:7930_t:CDS:2 [Ambispora gerdemannii]